MPQRTVQESVSDSVYRMRRRGTDISSRRLSWKALDQPSRVTVKQFSTAFTLSELEVDDEETECLLANMIFKSYMKGYISHERQTVVLAKGAAAFPPLRERKV